MQFNERNDMNYLQNNWRKDVHARLCELLEGESGVAIFDFDNTCIRGDIGELFGYFLVETMRYRYDLEEFWELVDEADGKARLRRLTEEAQGVEPEERERSEVYGRYLAEMTALYGRRLERLGKRDCYEWAVRLHVGLTPSQMMKWSTEAMERCLTTVQRAESFRTHDGRTVKIERGIRPLLEIRTLIEALEKAGWQVWVVSATNMWTVQVAAGLFGLPPERVLGNRVDVEDGRLTARTGRPVLFREGKCEIIEEVVGRVPDLVFGDAVTDYEMLCAARRLAVVIDRGDELLRREAKRRGWAIQPQNELTSYECEQEKQW